MKTCPFCEKGVLERKTILERYRYKGRTLDMEQAGAWCSVCEEGILGSAGLKATQKQIRDLQVQR